VTPLDNQTSKKSYLKDFSCETKKALLFYVGAEFLEFTKM